MNSLTRSNYKIKRGIALVLCLVALTACAESTTPMNSDSKQGDIQITEQKATNNVTQNNSSVLNQNTSEATESPSSSDTQPENASELKIVTQDGIETIDNRQVITNQSFKVDLNSWKNVRFISCQVDYQKDYDDAHFYLANDDNIIYTFPFDYEAKERPSGSFDSIGAVAFKDINNDDLTDVLIIINYVSGAGPQGMIPFPETRIYVADDSEFVLDTKLSEELYTAGITLDIPHILDYMKEKNN